ncbi:MAG: tetratricopeptide repeat protein [Candidatus Sumerlaeia bacterium]
MFKTDKVTDMRIPCILLLVFTILPSAMAKTVRVPGDEKDLSTAIKNCQPGDTVQIAPKYIYGKGVVIDKNISIICETSDAVIGNPTGPGILVTGDLSSINLIGLTIKGCVDDGIRIQEIKKPISCEFKKINLTANYGAGFNGIGNVRLNLLESSISNNTAEGIKLYGPRGVEITGDIKIDGCNLEGNKADAIFMHHCKPCKLVASNLNAVKNGNAIRINLAQGDSSTTLAVDSSTFSVNKHAIVVNGTTAARAETSASRGVFTNCTFDGSTSAGLKLIATQDLVWRFEKTKFSGNQVAIDLIRLNCPSIKFQDSSIQGNSVGMASRTNGVSSVPVVFSNTVLAGNSKADYLVHDPVVVCLTSSSSNSTARAILSEAATVVMNGSVNGEIRVEPDPLLNRSFAVKSSDETLAGIEKKSGQYWMSYCRASAQVCNHLDQAQDWADLGKIPNAFGNLLSAKKIFAWMNDHSYSQELLQPLRSEIQKTESKLKVKNTSPVDKVARYAHLMSLYDQYETLAGPVRVSGVNISISGNRDQVMQLALIDLVDAMFADPALIDGYAKFLTTSLKNDYDNADVAKMLAWTESSLKARNISEPFKNGEKYHMFMADEYARLEARKDELRHLTSILDSYTTSTTDVFVAGVANRVTELYEKGKDVRNTETALSTQRRISKLFPATESDYNARLRIARILMDDKKYEEAIAELNTLLNNLPKQYQDIPVRTLLGLALIGASRYDDARNELAGIQNRDSGEYRERALYLIGYSFIIEQKYAEAVRPFTDLVNLYPKGQYTRQAKDFISRINAGKK